MMDKTVKKKRYFPVLRDDRRRVRRQENRQEGSSIFFVKSRDEEKITDLWPRIYPAKRCKPQVREKCAYKTGDKTVGETGQSVAAGVKSMRKRCRAKNRGGAEA
jgi:hypothetical protein